MGSVVLVEDITHWFPLNAIPNAGDIVEVMLNLIKFKSNTQFMPSSEYAKV